PDRRPRREHVKWVTRLRGSCVGPGMRALLLLSLLGCSTADAQPSRPPDLGVRWDTTEGIWHGTWVRRGTSNTFTARWDCQQWPTFTGTVEVALDGHAVTVERRDDD